MSEVRLELLCGASDVEEDHVAYWDGETATHPTHDAIQAAAQAADIGVSVTGDYVNSDAYLYFHPSRIEDVIEILRQHKWTGDILDLPKRLSKKISEHLRQIAQKENWQVSILR